MSLFGGGFCPRQLPSSSLDPTSPWHGLWHQGAETVSASSPPSLTLPSSARSNWLCFLKKKKRHFVTNYRSLDQLTVRVLCICSTAQCKLVNTSFALYFVFIFSNKVLSCKKWGGELVANIRHCLFFSLIQIAHRNAFSCSVLKGDLTSQRGVWLVVLTSPDFFFFFLSQ